MSNSENSGNSGNSGNNNSMNGSNGPKEQVGGRRKGTRKASRSSRKGSKKQRGGQNTAVKMAGGASMRAVGSHAEVWHHTAHHTSGGLKRHDLMKNKHGRIVSRKKHALGKKALKNLVKAGFKAKKGTFKLFRK